MIKIRLFCAAGFSTGMLVNNMRAAATKKGIEVDIQADSQAKIAQLVEGIDVALLGPQVSYTLDKSKKVCDEKNVPIAVIPMSDYGTLNGEKVLDLALNLMQG
ncbi:PTS system, cellobiose-specific IIB component [Pilibacter termitis]|uniref:PTS system, cellobiose-specific IIB component n=1 Tax=Pilibacter termitis TaxID=263852 RepID=A0A1T4P5K1_9ENTE|nr:PTS sugar transporter subunit IIB [Pilibacter termitis]SJZ86536.1 PTS system, cellobiose-specific IIB component [Pilibacter termitis]